MNIKNKLPDGFAKELTKLVASNRGRRGVSKLCLCEHWSRAAEILAPLNRVAVVSGFFVPSAGAPETDGPGGAIVLARAYLEQGCASEIWTDELCVKEFKKCAESVGYPCELVKVPDVRTALAEYGPSGIIFTERLGRAKDGKYYNIRKKDISEWTLPLDLLADEASAKGIATVGIGDGGNEVGMGNFYSQLKELLTDYEECLAIVKVDAALPVDVSNWGAYALAASLSCLWGEWRGHSGEEEKKMLDALKSCGVVDGISCQAETSVDGFCLHAQIEVVSALRKIWRNFT